MATDTNNVMARGDANWTLLAPSGLRYDSPGAAAMVKATYDKYKASGSDFTDPQAIAVLEKYYPGYYTGTGTAATPGDGHVIGKIGEINSGLIAPYNPVNFGDLPANQTPQPRTLPRRLPRRIKLRSRLIRGRRMGLIPARPPGSAMSLRLNMPAQRCLCRGQTAVW